MIYIAPCRGGNRGKSASRREASLAQRHRGRDMHPAFRRFRDELSATAVRIFAYIGIVAVIVITGFTFFRMPDVQAAIEPTAWTAVERPFRAFAVSVPEFDQAEPDYAIQRHAVGGGRKDIMSWGDADAARSRLLIEIYRPGWEISEFGTFY